MKMARTRKSGPSLAAIKPRYLVTVTVTEVVCVTPPPVPVTVMVWFPRVAFFPAVIFNAEFPDPGAAIDVGLKLTVSPPPADPDNAIAELNPFDATVVIVVLPVELRFTVMLDGPAEIVKLPVAAAVTVSETVVVWVAPPPDPWIVMG